MNKPVTEQLLRLENLAYTGTRGVSAGNRAEGFVPAFCDIETGHVEISRFADGRPAPLHLIDGLPSHWVERRDAAGRIAAIKASVLAGFVRDGCFYTRAQVAAVVLH